MDVYQILIILSVIVVLSYVFNILAEKLKIPSALLLMASGIGLKYAADSFHFQLPPSNSLLQILGITGLIFIVLEASLDLSIRREKLRLIVRAFVSALMLLGFTSALIALLFATYYETSFQQALLYAIPLSIISSAMAIPSVNKMEENKREFVVYESTFSDIIGIIAFNYFITDHDSNMGALLDFSWSMVLIFLISIVSTTLLIFLLNHVTTHIRFFLTFAILILTYSTAKIFHLPSLVLVLCFGLVLNNFRLFDHPMVHKYFSFERLREVSIEMKLMTAETAFIIRTFFFILFGYSVNLALLATKEVILLGTLVILITLMLRFVFLRYILKINSAPLTLIAPRGLITILLFFSIPEDQRLLRFGEGVLFIVIVFTGILMTIGLLLNKQDPKEESENVI